MVGSPAISWRASSASKRGRRTDTGTCDLLLAKAPAPGDPGILPAEYMGYARFWRVGKRFVACGVPWDGNRRCTSRARWRARRARRYRFVLAGLRSDKRGMQNDSRAARERGERTILRAPLSCLVASETEPARPSETR